MATYKESRMGVEVPSPETSLSRIPRLLNLCSPHATAVNTTPQKTPPPATLSAHNLDLTTVTIAFTTPSVAVTGNRCRVSLRGQNPYALTNPVSRPRLTYDDPDHPPAHRLS